MPLSYNKRTTAISSPGAGYLVDIIYRGEGGPVVVVPPVEGGVVVRPAVPGPVQVVRHHVDEGEVAGDAGNVIAVTHAELRVSLVNIYTA